MSSSRLKSGRNLRNLQTTINQKKRTQNQKTIESVHKNRIHLIESMDTAQ